LKFRFCTKDFALWLHPLGLVYVVRVSKTGCNAELGDYAIISLGGKCLVCVSQANLLSVSEVSERNKLLADQMQGKKLE